MNLAGDVTALEDNPCNGWCTSSIFGDVVCKGCGRAEEEIRDWNNMSVLQRKLRVIDLAEHNYPIRHLGRKPHEVINISEQFSNSDQK